MGSEFPMWLSWLEIVYALPACFICCFLFVILIRTPISIGCKIFLYINTTSLFVMALLHCLIAEWTIRHQRGLGLQELHFFPLILAHQFFYGLSAAALFNLACERLLLCFHPNFYETHQRWFFPALMIALLIIVLRVVPILIILQFGGYEHISTALEISFELAICVLLLVCYRQSRYFYRTQFAKVSLNIRYQVKEVVDLTRVFIPIGLTSLVHRMLIEILATFVFTDVSAISTFVLVLRIVATSMAYFESILLMVRHKLIARKIIVTVTRGRIRPTEKPEEYSTGATTRQYFEALQKDWK